MSILANLGFGAAVWTAISVPVALFVGRMASHKWHPDGGKNG